MGNRPIYSCVVLVEGKLGPFFQTLQRSVEKSRPKSILATDFKYLHSMVSFGGVSSSSDQLVSFLCKEQAHATGIQ